MQFDNLYCNLVSAGETSGTLDAILDRLATYKEKILAIKSKINPRDWTMRNIENEAKAVFISRDPNPCLAGGWTGGPPASDQRNRNFRPSLARG